MIDWWLFGVLLCACVSSLIKCLMVACLWICLCDCLLLIIWLVIWLLFDLLYSWLAVVCDDGPLSGVCGLIGWLLGQIVV